MTGAPGGTPGTAVLELRGLTRRFGGITAVDGLSLRVHPGETLGVIGPNGAGKSTLIDLISGAVAATAGHVHLNGTDITRLGAPARARLGIGRTHQVPRPFGGLSVLENLLLAARHAHGGRHRGAAGRRRCLEILERTGLHGVAGTPAGELPLLRRKRLELARALASRPRLLLLDEIGAGLVEHETAELTALIRELRADVDAMVVVEHVMDVITSCCDRTAALDFGRLVASGPTSQVLRDPTVAAVYLGTAAAHPAGAAPQLPPLPPPLPSSSPSWPLPPPLPSSSPSWPLPPSLPLPSVSPPRPVPSSPTVGGPATPALLEVRDVHVAYDGVRALRGVTLRLGQGEVVALLGANGAGKTTLARAISGVVPVSAGSIAFDGQRIDRLPPDRIAALGLAHCMEGRRIFGRLSVQENLVLAAGAAPRPEISARLAAAYDAFPVLAERRGQPGTALSGGQQQMLAIARALMSAPRAVIFDEISLGLAPVAVDRLYDALTAVRASGVAILLIEQNLERGLSLADRAYLLAGGRVALAGTPDHIRRHPALASLYVGESGREPERTTAWT